MRPSPPSHNPAAHRPRRDLPRRMSLDAWWLGEPLALHPALKGR
ncbi:MAG: hypothetical protein ACU0CI_01780 [Shimia sp.]